MKSGRSGDIEFGRHRLNAKAAAHAGLEVLRINLSLIGSNSPRLFILFMHKWRVSKNSKPKNLQNLVFLGFDFEGCVGVS
jgi:hypothetical protein